MVTAAGTASVLGQPGPASWRAPGWLLAWVMVFGMGLGAAPAWAQTAAQGTLQTTAQTAAEQPTLVIEIGSHSAPVRRIDVHPGRGVAVTASDDRTARIWDLATGDLRHVLRPLAAGNEVGRLYGAAVHPTQPLVAVAGTSGSADTAHLIYLFDIDSGALRRTIDAKGGDIRKLVWSTDGTVLLAGYSGNPASNHGVRAFALDGRELLDDRLPGPVFGLAVAASGQAAAVGLDGTLRRYRVGNGAASVAGSTQINGRRPAGVSFSPDGSRLAVAYATPREGPEIFDSATLGSVGRLPAEALFGGDWRVLAWSADGLSIYVGGTAYTQALRFPVLQYDVANARVVARIDAANDSITDLQALPSGEVAYTSFDGSWGVIGNVSGAGREAPQVTPQATPQVLRRVGAPVATVRGNAPLDLALSDDARTLRWGASSGSGFGFAFDKRRLQTAGQALPGPSGPSLRQPDTRFGLFNAPADWNQESRPPVIGGRAMALAADERGRALAVLRATAGAPAAAIVGTNRALYRVSEQGSVTWRMPVDTEIRALNTSADGRFLVGAMADATVRWWRASDGRLLLTLLAQADGRWVVWTPSGYYDASAGADRLVGWALPRGQQQAMSYFSLNRFRDRFNRPDLIDAIFTQADETAALAALAAREEQARLAAQTQARDQADAARAAARAAEVAAELAAERAAREQARQAALRESDMRAAAQAAAAAADASRAAAQRAEAARAEEGRRAAAERVAQVEAQRSAERLAAEQAAQAEATRLAIARESLARAAAEQAARDSALRAEESRLAEALRLAATARAAVVAQQAAQQTAQQAAQQAARAEQQEAEREAARKVALARAAAEREAAARQAAAQAAAQAAKQAAALATQAEQTRLAQEREQAARVAQAREQAAREQTQRQAADREAARLLAESQAAAIATAQREAAQRAAALEAQRLAAQLEQAKQTRVAAAREAAAREEAAQAAAREAAQQLAAAQARKALQALKAAEFPPSLQAVSALRVKATTAEVSLPFALLSATAAGDVDVQVRSNGRPMQPAELVVPKSVDGRTQGLARVQVGEGRTQIEILASNRYGVSEPLVFVIDRDQVAAVATAAAAAAAATRPPLPPSADLYVLAIGVADYARAEYKLGLAAKDARDFAAAMQRQEGRLYRRVIVRTLTDKGATRAAVLRELDLLRSTVTAADVAMVFIAGHGINDPSGTYYFLPHDGQHERLATTAVAQDAIVSGLSKIRGKTILFVDTCFAGNALGALTKVGRQTEKLMNDLSASENGVVVFASSTGHEESEEKDEWGNGAFTKALLDGLSGKADFMRAGRVTYAGLNLFVSEEVTRLTSGRQRPVFISPRGIPDFAVARL